MNDQQISLRQLSVMAVFAAAFGIAIGYGTAWIMSSPIMTVAYHGVRPTVTVGPMPPGTGLLIMGIMFVTGITIAVCAHYVMGWCRRRFGVEPE